MLSLSMVENRRNCCFATKNCRRGPVRIRRSFSTHMSELLCQADCHYSVRSQGAAFLADQVVGVAVLRMYDDPEVQITFWKVTCSS